MASLTGHSRRGGAPDATKGRERDLIDRLAAGGSFDVVAQLDADNRFVWVSSSVEAFMGVLPEEEIGRDALSRVHPDDLGPVLTALSEAVTAKAETLKFEYRYRHGQGHYLWNELEAYLLYDQDGGYAGAVLGARDITSRRAAENALRARDEEFRHFFGGAPDLMWTMDPSGHVLRVNSQWIPTLGFLPEEIEGTAVLDLLHPDDRESYHAALALAKREPVVDHVHRWRSRNGEYRWIEWRSVPVGGRIYAAARDVTQRHRDEELLRESRSRLDAILEHLTELVWMKDRNGVYLAADRAFVLACGRASAEEVIGTTDFGLWPEAQAAKLRADDELVMATGTAITMEEPLVVHGEERWFETTKTPLRDAEGRVIGTVGSARDVTAHRRAVVERTLLLEQLAQAQKMESIGRLAGGVAHDFNNFLTAMRGHLELLLLLPDVAEPVRGRLLDMRRAVDSAARLTGQLLAFSRKQVIAPTVLDLNEMLGSLEPMLNRLLGEDVDLRTELAPDLGRIRADRSQLEQVVANLAVNARDAMPGGGRLTVRTENVLVEEGKVVATGEPARSSHVALLVSDTGCGMSEEVKAHLFEPFYTTKPPGQGTGLGLAMVYGAVQQNCGRIEVVSEQGRGTTFAIHFPLAAEAGVEELPDAARGGIRGGSETILLVEDSPLVRDLAREVLSWLGYRVLASATAEDALAAASGCEVDIDLLLTDVVLPKMNGRDLAAALTADRPGLRVLFTSGYTDEVLGQRGVLDSGLRFLAKPYSPQSLAAKIREVLDQD